MNEAIIIYRVAVAIVFVVAGIGKLADLPGSKKSMADFGVPKALAGFFAFAVPLAELAAAVALIPGGTAWYGAALALALLVAFIGGISVNLALGKKPDCHCFGQVHSAPIGWKTLARNGVLALLCLDILFYGGQRQPDVWVWAAIAAAAGANFWLMLHLIRQNGRLLLRVEQLEARIGLAGMEPQAAGLAQGAPAPHFDSGGMTLKKILAAKKQALLVFTGPDCGPCQALLPEVESWRSKYAEMLAIHVIDEAGSKRPIAESYQCPGTPGAVLVKADGTIGSPIAMGADQIRTLVSAAVMPPPVQKGDAAPPLALPDLEGRSVALNAYLGKETVLLFWNPGCGFCREILDRLKEWEAGAARGLRELLVISGGSAADNRAQGFRSRILLDDSFGTAHAFGAAGTPSAIMVGRDGRIASAVAVGAEEVLALIAG